MAFFSFLSWFRPWWKTAETDYETVLSRLSKDINDVQERLVRVNQRERRASVTLTLYAVLLWLSYALFIWISTSDERRTMNKGQRLQLWLPVIAGLAFIVSVRTLVRLWFGRVSEGEEKHLRSLQRARRKKIDEIKQATRFDHLRTLLERYDDTAPSNRAGLRKGPGSGLDVRAQSKNTSFHTPLKPSPRPPPISTHVAQRQFQGMKDGVPIRGGGGGAPLKDGKDVKTDENGDKSVSISNSRKDIPSIITSQGGSKLPFDAPQRQMRFEKTWLDRLADNILGVGPSNQDVAAEQRYALICCVCFSHNGLCPKEDWEEVQYICPRCGTFNSRRPSSVPVTSPWAPSTNTRRASLSNSPIHRRQAEGLDLSPARSMLELPLPRSPSSRSLLIDSISAPSLMSAGSTREEADEDVSASSNSLALKGEGIFENREVTKKEDKRKGDGSSEVAEEEEAIEEIKDDDPDTHAEEAVRRGGRESMSTGRKRHDDAESLRKRQISATESIDDNEEPMQVD